MYSKFFLSASVRSYLWTKKDLDTLLKKNPQLKQYLGNKDHNEVLEEINEFNIRKERRCRKIY